jgi:hypothetical protein
MVFLHWVYAFQAMCPCYELMRRELKKRCRGDCRKVTEAHTVRSKVAACRKFYYSLIIRRPAYNKSVIAEYQLAK